MQKKIIQYSLARYACLSNEPDIQRIQAEPISEIRTPFQRDRDRIIHSTAFRRLKHKTQVFLSPDGDHVRTRLTHSLEVAQIARTITRYFHLNEDLAETLSYAHDLGHPPFGHLGEEALDQVIKEEMVAQKTIDGQSITRHFDHNEHGLRIVTILEHRHPQFYGLNLTYASLEGLIKHSGPLNQENSTSLGHELCQSLGIKPEAQPSLEAQIAGISDDIAYNHHDIDDGLRSRVFSLEELTDFSPYIKRVIDQIKREYTSISHDILCAELIRRLIGEAVTDLINQCQYRLEQLAPMTIDDIRQSPQTLAVFSTEMQQQQQELKKFLKKKMYFTSDMNANRKEAQKIISDIFKHLYQHPNDLPDDWQDRLNENSLDKGRIILDYVAGMTDKFALHQHEKLFQI